MPAFGGEIPSRCEFQCDFRVDELLLQFDRLQTLLVEICFGLKISQHISRPLVRCLLCDVDQMLENRNCLLRCSYLAVERSDVGDGCGDVCVRLKDSSFVFIKELLASGSFNRDISLIAIKQREIDRYAESGC